MDRRTPRPAAENETSLPGLVSRRGLLQIGSLGLAATALPGLTLGSTLPEGKAKSVILLWMGGGVTHIDSFDPKPDAPEEIRGTLTEIATSLPGVRFTEAMPQLSKIAHELCLVRSFSHDSNDHLLSQAHTLSGRKVTQQQLLTEPNIGSIVAKLHGPRAGLPGYIAVPGITRPGPPPWNLFVGGWLGNSYAPFCTGGIPEQPDFTVGEKSENPSPIAEEDLSPRSIGLAGEMTPERLNHRLRLRDLIERSLRAAEQSDALETMDSHYQSALGLLTSPQVRGAFDLSKESAATRDNYGRTKLGGRCLLARRLVEAGARFVMVDYGYDNDYGNFWDNHAVPVQKQPHISEMCKRGYHVAGLDKSFAALITDLKQRGLLDSTLVVFLTEFGRTPKINKNGGRDHWGACGSIFFTGAGTPVGQVIGASDKQGGYPITRGYSPADVAATIYKAIGINTSTRLRDFQNRPRFVLEEGESII